MANRSWPPYWIQTGFRSKALISAHCRVLSTLQSIFCVTLSNGLNAIGGQFAILSVPAMSLTVHGLNEDSDAEFIANPRIVTADNKQATIEIIRTQPVPQLNFNEQTARRSSVVLRTRNSATR